MDVKQHLRDSDLFDEEEREKYVRFTVRGHPKASIYVDHSSNGRHFNVLRTPLDIATVDVPGGPVLALLAAAAEASALSKNRSLSCQTYSLRSAKA